MLDTNARRTLVQALRVKVYANNYHFKVTWHFDPARGVLGEDACEIIDVVATDMHKRKQKGQRA